MFFIGDGPAVSENKKYVVNNHLEKFVIFAGAIERMYVADYIAGLDIAIQPRVTDYASPMKIIEYMVMGKAIIAPDKQNINDILKNGENALLFKSEDMSDLYDKLELIIKDKDFREKLSRNALNTVTEKNLYWLENAKKSINILTIYDLVEYNE